jgi:hypothetical protein
MMADRVERGCETKLRGGQDRLPVSARPGASRGVWLANVMIRRGEFERGATGDHQRMLHNTQVLHAGSETQELRAGNQGF